MHLSQYRSDAFISSRPRILVNDKVPPIPINDSTKSTLMKVITETISIVPCNSNNEYFPIFSNIRYLIIIIYRKLMINYEKRGEI